MNLIQQLKIPKRKPEKEIWQCSHSYRDVHSCEPRVQCKEVSDSDAGKALREKFRLIQMENELSSLREMLEEILPHVDHEELQASKKLKSKTPSNATLKLWASKSTPLEHLDDEPAEHLW